MGILDDAIREHLELRRRNGAVDDEVQQLERRLLGEEPQASPEADAEAHPSPGEGVQTWVVPATMEHRLLAVPPTMAVITGVLPEFQSFEVCARRDFQFADDRLSPSLSVNGLVVRAQ